jgi:hypothetical protein
MGKDEGRQGSEHWTILSAPTFTIFPLMAMHLVESPGPGYLGQIFLGLISIL